jgi:maleate isomerase
MNRRRFLALTSAAPFAPPVFRVDAGDAGQRPGWRPDGAGLVARIGVLTPDFDPVPESEMAAMPPRGVSIHASRVVRYRTPAGFAEPPHIDNAAERLADLAPHAIAVGYTSSSYVLGPNSDDGVRARLEARAGGRPVVLPTVAATDGLRALGVRRVALVHPPWFNQEVNAKGEDYFAARGFDVVLCERMTPSRTFAEVRAVEVYDWVRSRVPRTADAVFIGGNGLRAIGAIDALESALRRPVLTANQAVFWGALRAAKVRIRITGYGRLYETT